MVMNLRDVITISLTEMRSLLRDRHTLVYSVLIPFLLYPVLLIGTGQAIIIARGAQERRISRVALLDREAFPRMAACLTGKEKDRLELVDPTGEASRASSRMIDGWIDRRELDAVVVPSRGPGDSLRAEILYKDTSDASSTARERLEQALDDFGAERLKERARALGQDEGFLDTLDVRMVNLVPLERRIQEAIARVVPLLLVLMIAIGAFYPALDVTVGERERGTIETTLLVPVKRTTLVLGKFLPVVGFSILSAMLNFLSMAMAFQIFLYQVKPEFYLPAIAPVFVVVILGGILLLAFLSSAVMLAVSLLARSFKEGQSYLGAILLVSMAPGLAASIPEVPLNVPLALTPIMNLALLVRDAFLEKLDPAMGLLALVASALYAALAIQVASHLTRRETVLLGAPAATVSRRGLLARILKRG